MIKVYRFAPEKFCKDFTGTGAKLFGGRWNTIGVEALYTSASISLAMVELFVHKQVFGDVIDMHLVEIELDIKKATSIIDKKKLKSNWKTDYDYCQYIGTEFLHVDSNFCLQVPSAIVDEENNFILNPRCDNFKQLIAQINVRPYYFDVRLFKS
jgi:RES domain-containing protein